MTGASPRVIDPSEYYDTIPSTLWRPANLPRLPSDAPAEISKYTIDLNDPKKIYLFHRAQRRHGFQELVQRFENQLVYGCQAAFCDTPTCFTCARRVAGRAPIRRFNDTSARTLACYLASQDNPELSLCRNPSAAPLEKSAMYGKRRSKTKPSNGEANSLATPGGHIRRQSDDTGISREISKSDALDGPVTVRRIVNGLSPDEQKKILAERMDQLREPKKKDNKSFIQSLYGTVSLKMLDWLSPQNLHALSSPEMVSKSLQNGTTGQETPADSLPSTNLNTPIKRPHRTPSRTSERKVTISEQPEVAHTPQETRRSSEVPVRTMALNGNTKVEAHNPECLPEPQSPMLPSKPGAIIIPSQPAIQQEQAESINPDVVLKLWQEKQPKPCISRRRSLKKSHRLSASRQGQVTPVVDVDIEIQSRETEPPKESKLELDKPSDPQIKSEDVKETSSTEKQQEPDSREDIGCVARCQNLQPQSLSIITPEIVEFFCNFMQDHDICESHDFYPTAIYPLLHRVRRDVPPIKFPTDMAVQDSKNDRKIEWKKFIEQSLFFVLSNPDKLQRSFVNDQGKLMDSLSMWYLMVRLTRVSPTIVFDSLWMSASRLFNPPKGIQSRNYWVPRSIPSEERRFFPGDDSEASGPCQSDEAAKLVLICLHALAAAMPLKFENKLGAKATSWSRVFNGERRAVARELPSGAYKRRLRYYDAFSNESALRLARRLFGGIASVLRYEELTSIERGDYSRESQGQFTFFGVLLAYVEASQFPKDLPVETLLDFSQEFAERESTTTTPTHHDISKQMVEWARTVILQEWKGEAEISSDGVFGGALAFMSAMYRNRERVALNDSDFVVEHFAGRLSTMEVPVEWLAFTPNRKTLHLLDHPYLFKAASLIDYFRSINLHRMRKAYEAAVNYNSRTEMAMARSRLMTDANHRTHLFDRLRTALNKYLVLEIRRDQVLQDSFDQLWRREIRELLRPFKVRLGENLGEEGFDLGGVQQEFFRLAITEALDPSYGTFSMDERTKMIWFVPTSLTPLWRCELIGLIISLAVYNGLTLPVTFPLAMYRKLLGLENTEIEHIEDGWPDLAKGLRTLLEWDEEKDGEVADVFARTYEFSVEAFGEQISRDMSRETSWPQFGTTKVGNPNDASLVDGNNRNAYVKDYIRWLTDVSIRPQYEAFKSGFYACLDLRSLSLFEPHILQSVVEGVQEIDISELRRNTRYVGWSSSNKTVRDFWSIVKRYDTEKKKKLLEFVTASDRVPVGGMQGLNFVLQKNGSGDDGGGGRLPTSYTCFATLLLPEYGDKDVLGEKLELAISNSRGFGLL